MALIYYLCHIPQANTVYWLGCDYLSDAIYWVDILFVKPRIMFLDASGIYETGRKQCAKNYVRHGDFKVDIISVIPFELVYIFLGVRGWTTIFRANRRSCFCCNNFKNQPGQQKYYWTLKLKSFVVKVRPLRVLRQYAFSRAFGRLDAASKYPMVIRMIKTINIMVILMHVLGTAPIYMLH